MTDEAKAITEPLHEAVSDYLQCVRDFRAALKEIFPRHLILQHDIGAIGIHQMASEVRSLKRLVQDKLDGVSQERILAALEGEPYHVETWARRNPRRLPRLVRDEILSANQNREELAAIYTEAKKVGELEKIWLRAESEWAILWASAPQERQWRLHNPPKTPSCD